MNQPIQSRVRAQSGSIVGEETGGGNLRLSKSHTPSESFVIERAELDDLMVVLDALLGHRKTRLYPESEKEQTA